MKTAARGRVAKLFDILLVLVVVTTVCWVLLRPLLPASFSSLPYASLNVPVTGSAGPGTPPSRKDVLMKYPTWFATDQSDGSRRTTIAAHTYGINSFGSSAVCFVGWTRIHCGFSNFGYTSFALSTLVPLPVSSLNIIVPNSDTGVSRKEVLKYYPSVFAVDWEDGVFVTEAALMIHMSLGDGHTTCSIGDDFLNCISGNMSVIYGGYQFYRWDYG
jgi:hypothetical protein